MQHDQENSKEPGSPMNRQKLRDYAFEMGPIRPPSEGQDRSLLIRATRNCPWNRCEFCRTYKGKRFEYRSPEEVKQDIDIAKAISDELKAASWRIGYGGEISGEVVRAVVHGNPDIYSKETTDPETLTAKLESLVHVANWLSSGARTAFLQDANSLIMRTPELVEVIKYLKQTFPSIERVTSYARSKTTAQKSLDELKELHQAGFSRLHVGLESGYDELLKEIQKGVTQEEHISGGIKVVKSGISLSEYVMPGLGGKKWSEPHALETAKTLNQINPDFIRLRSLIAKKGSSLHDRLESGEFEELGEDEVVDEIGLLIENLNCQSYVVSDQMSNLLMEIEGKLPEDKRAMLEIISKYKAMPLLERLEFRLKRRLGSYLSVYGGLGDGLRERVEAAFNSIESEAPDAEEKANEAILALKQDFI